MRFIIRESPLLTYDTTSTKYCHTHAHTHKQTSYNTTQHNTILHNNKEGDEDMSVSYCRRRRRRR